MYVEHTKCTSNVYGCDKNVFRVLLQTITSYIFLNKASVAYQYVAEFFVFV